MSKLNFLLIVILIIPLLIFVPGCSKREKYKVEQTSKETKPSNTDYNKDSLRKGTTNVQQTQINSKTFDKALSAQQLYDEFKNNPFACEEKYEGQRLKVTGKIVSLNKSFWDDESLIIYIEGKEWNNEVMCYMNKDQRSYITKLSKGQNVSIVGEVEASDPSTPRLVKSVIYNK